MAEKYSKQLFLFVAILIAGAKTQPISKPNCTTECGNVTIPFPFGMTEECSLDTSFLVTCNQTSSPPIPFLKNNASVSVLNITLDGELHVSLPVATECYDNRTAQYVNENDWQFDLSPFRLSPFGNRLTTVGVDTVGAVVPLSRRSKTYTATLCMSLYEADFVINGSCDGTGCCSTIIKQGLSNFYYTATSDVINSTYYNNLYKSYPCGYAFLVKKGAYNFSSTDLVKFNEKTKYPVVLDWAVGNHTTCEEAKRNNSTYACISDHSKCVDATEGGGYLCNCSDGFRGNAYLSGGCLDINECMESNDCVREAKCNNFLGSYSCTCPKGYAGDGKHDGTGCSGKFKKGMMILIIALSILALIAGSFYAYRAWKRRKFIKLKEQFFQQNGGLLLQQQIARHGGRTEITKIFSVEELKAATNNFNEDRILGQGGQGTVYQGVLPDNRTVAIKISKINAPNQIEQFINEVIVLSQINHRNVVKILGCCLETKVPMLVYEFIPNGTLYEHLHGENHSLKLTWKARLRIATEIAGALAYLHSATSEPIIHRDVKTTNILLDQNLTAKVSDFGTSRIVNLDHTQITTLVQGTLGYLDPEYLQTSQLTDKSDVYSFGVVLAELVSGKKALSFDKQEENRNINLALYFISSTKEERLLDIVDKHIIDEANVEQLMEYAKIATQCLKVKGEERPTMKEVARELERLGVAKLHQQESVKLSSEDISYSVENDASGSGISSCVHSLTQVSMSLEDGR